MAFNQGSPLNLQQHDDILVASLIILCIFTREDQTSPIEHIRDIASLCGLHHVTQDNFDVILLAMSLKGKTLQWFRGLLVNSIASWDELGTILTT